MTAAPADLARELPLPPFADPVAWVAEGLFFYLAGPSIVDPLRRAAERSPAGGVFLADVMGTTGLTGPALRVPGVVRADRQPAAVRV